MADPVDRLPALGNPRALPRDLRTRLEDALLGADARPLSEDQTASLKAHLRDPVGELLVGLDAPRPLSSATRKSLERSLARPQRRWLPVAGAASVAAVAAAVALLALPGDDDDRVTSLPQAPTATARPGAGADAGTTGGGEAAGGTTGTTGAALPPVPQAVGGGVPDRSGGGPAVQQPAPTYGTAATKPTSTTSPAPQRPPTVDRISPTSGRAGTWVTLTGHDLLPTRTVTFGGTPASRVVQVSATQVQALAPAHAPGPVDVVLTTAAGSSAPVRFVYLL